MNSKTLYIRNIRDIFSIKGKKEKEYLKRLINNINEFDEDYPNSSYDELEDKFGTPKEIYLDYLENQDSSYLINRLKMKMLIKKICIFIALVCTLLSTWKGYLIYKDYKESSSYRVTNVEITPPEEINNEKISD